LTESELEAGYWRAYRDFYCWGSILRGASTKNDLTGRVRHLAYAAGLKKFEPFWDVVIRSRQVLHALPALEAILAAGRSASHHRDLPISRELDRDRVGRRTLQP
jgi:hypothetical protein